MVLTRCLDAEDDGLGRVVPAEIATGEEYERHVRLRQPVVFELRLTRPVERPFDDYVLVGGCKCMP